jgi:hypothetical protein
MMSVAVAIVGKRNSLQALLPTVSIVLATLILDTAIVMHVTTIIEI